MMKKLKKKTGVTLGETLVTILILLMVSSVVAGGIPSALSAYSKAIDAANAQVALSTTLNALRREFSSAWDVRMGSTNTELRYFKADTGALTKLSMVDGVIKVQDYVSYDGEGNELMTPYNLVSEKAAAGNLRVSYDLAAVNDGVVTFSGVKVVKATDNATVAELDSLSVRLITGELVIPDLPTGG